MKEADDERVATMDLDSSELRMVAGLRLALACVALAITFIDPTEPSGFLEFTYALLAAYLVASAALYAARRRWLHVHRRIREAPYYWVDVTVCVALVALSGGSNSIYFLLFFFAILGAAFRHGFGAGIQVTVICVVMFVLVSLAQKPLDPDFDLNGFLIRSSMLPIIGYLISYWGGRQAQQVRRLAFLNELGHLANRRLDVERILALVMDRLREFFVADSCIVITGAGTGTGADEPPLLRRVTAADVRGAPLAAEPAPQAVAEPLLGLMPDEPVVYRKPGGLGRHAELTVVGAPRRAPEADAHDLACCRAAAAFFEAESFISVPLRLTPHSAGRLYLACGRRTLTARDAEFLALAAEHFTPTLQYVALIDRMASQVIEDERHRIALDIHDHIIQPYIGLQLGLTALTQLLEKASAEQPVPAALTRAQQLMAMTADGIADLRQYVGRLKTNASATVATPSMFARFVARYSQAAGIDVELRLCDESRGNNMAAEAAFPIVAEALSNVRRHTVANRAVVDLQLQGGWLRIRVENPVDAGAVPADFVPKSITERVTAVGGSVRVEPNDRGMTRLTADLPV